MCRRMKWEDIRGHQQVVRQFCRTIERGRLSHAYLFVGPNGIGKKLFARMLGQSLLCQDASASGPQLPGIQVPSAQSMWEPCGECPNCKRVTAGTHPDFFVVGCLEGKAELTIDVFVGSKERRGREGLCYELSLRPMAGDRRVAIIDDADLMNEESANALLKTLEEPPPNSLLLLIAGNMDRLLPTIRSRCQHVRFAPLGPQDIADLLIQNETLDDRAEAERVAALSDGSLAVAAQLVDPALRTLRDTLYGHLSGFQFEPLALTSALVSGLDELGGDSVTQRRNAAWLIRFCIEFYRCASLQLAGHDGGPSIDQVDQFLDRWGDQSSGDLELVMALFDRAVRAENQLEWKTPFPLCLEGLFADLARMARAACD